MLLIDLVAHVYSIGGTRWYSESIDVFEMQDAACYLCSVLLRCTGELMDHGLDSFSVSIIVLSVPSVFTVQSAFSANVNELFILYFVTILGFYLSHWEKYLTGVLYLPWTYDASMLVGTCTADTRLDRLWTQFVVVY